MQMSVCLPPTSPTAMHKEKKKQLQCCVIITVNILQNAHNKTQYSSPMRVRYRVCFVNSMYDLYSALASAVLYVLLYHIITELGCSVSIVSKYIPHHCFIVSNHAFLRNTAAWRNMLACGKTFSQVYFLKIILALGTICSLSQTLPGTYGYLSLMNCQSLHK